MLAQGAVFVGLAGVRWWPERSWLVLYLFLLRGCQGVRETAMDPVGEPFDVVIPCAPTEETVEGLLARLPSPI